jgi:hypothetical protein
MIRGRPARPSSTYHMDSSGSRRGKRDISKPATRSKEPTSLLSGLLCLIMSFLSIHTQSLHINKGVTPASYLHTYIPYSSSPLTPFTAFVPGARSLLKLLLYNPINPVLVGAYPASPCLVVLSIERTLMYPPSFFTSLPPFTHHLRSNYISLLYDYDESSITIKRAPPNALHCLRYKPRGHSANLQPSNYIYSSGHHTITVTCENRSTTTTP